MEQDQGKNGWEFQIVNHMDNDIDPFTDNIVRSAGFKVWEVVNGNRKIIAAALLDKKCLYPHTLSSEQIEELRKPMIRNMQSGLTRDLEENEDVLNTWKRIEDILLNWDWSRSYRRAQPWERRKLSTRQKIKYSLLSEGIVK